MTCDTATGHVRLDVKLYYAMVGSIPHARVYAIIQSESQPHVDWILIHMVTPYTPLKYLVFSQNTLTLTSL